MATKIDISAIVSLIKDFDYEMLNDSEWDELKKVNPANENDLLQVFNQITVPEYEAMDSRSKELIKSSLEGVLSSADFNYQEILGLVEMPFEPIEQPSEFFATLWLSLFKVRFR